MINTLEMGLKIDKHIGKGTKRIKTLEMGLTMKIRAKVHAGRSPCRQNYYCLGLCRLTYIYYCLLYILLQNNQVGDETPNKLTVPYQTTIL